MRCTTTRAPSNVRETTGRRASLRRAAPTTKTTTATAAPAATRLARLRQPLSLLLRSTTNRAFVARASASSPSTSPPSPSDLAAMDEAEVTPLPRPSSPESEEHARTLRLAKEVIERLNDRGGHVALIAGGWVRDALLGRAPLDVDVATSADASVVREAFERVVPMPNDTLIVVHGGVPFEVTPFRGGGGAEAEASTEATTARPPAPSSSLPRRDLRGYAAAAADARLRDFTVNALFCDPVSGTVLDWVGGRRDLSSKLLRCCSGKGESDGEERLREDPLRCLRAVRFAAGLGLTVEEGTARSVRALAPLLGGGDGGGGERVAAERIWKELCKLSSCEAERPGAFADGVSLARDLGVLRAILPEAVGGGEGAEGETDAALRRLPADAPAVLRVATALPDSVAFPRSSDRASSFPALMTQRFKLSKKETKLLEALSALRSLDETTTAVGDDDEEGDDGSSASKRQRTGEEASTAAFKKKRDTMAWVRFYSLPEDAAPAAVAASTARIADDGERERYAAAHARRISRLSRGIERARARSPVVTASVAKAHGVRPGPEMGKLLAAAEEAAVERGIDDAGAVVDFLKERGVWPTS